MRLSHIVSLLLIEWFVSFLVCASEARADVAVIVNLSNASVWGQDAKENVKDIFLGKRGTFPDGRKARAIDQKHGTVREEFYQKLIGKNENELSAYWSNLIFTGNGQPPKVVGVDADVKKMIQENENDIGYIDAKLADATVKTVYVIKSSASEGP